MAPPRPAAPGWSCRSLKPQHRAQSAFAWASFDMTAYSKYFASELTDEKYDESELGMALAGLPSVPVPA